MTSINNFVINEASLATMLVRGISKDQLLHALHHGATVKFIHRKWKSHAHLKVSYKDVGGITKIDIIHHD